MVNGIPASKLREWFDGLDDFRAQSLIAALLTVEPVIDVESRLKDGPWFIIWANSQHLKSVKVKVNAETLGADPEWNTCVDLSVTDQLGVEKKHYDIVGVESPWMFDASCRELTPMYSGATLYYAMVRPKGAEDRLFKIYTETKPEELPSGKVSAHFIHLVPREFWLIQKDQMLSQDEWDKMNAGKKDEPEYTVIRG